MVRAEGDGGKGVDHIDQQARQRTAQQTDPVGAGNVAHQKAHQRADGGKTLQTDIDHTGSLPVQLGERNEQHRMARRTQPPERPERYFLFLRCFHIWHFTPSDAG